MAANMSISSKIRKIELVKDRTGATYSEAMEALEKTDGSVIDAILFIEKRIDGEEEKEDGSSNESMTDEEKKINDTEDKGSYIIDNIKKIIRKGNVARILIKKEEEIIVNIPVNAGILGMIFVPWVTILSAVAALGTKCSISLVKNDGDVIDLSGKAAGKIGELKTNYGHVADDIIDKGAGAFNQVKEKATETVKKVKTDIGLGIDKDDYFSFDDDLDFGDDLDFSDDADSGDGSDSVDDLDFSDDSGFDSDIDVDDIDFDDDIDIDADDDSDFFDDSFDIDLEDLDAFDDEAFDGDPFLDDIEAEINEKRKALEKRAAEEKAAREAEAVKKTAEKEAAETASEAEHTGKSGTKEDSTEEAASSAYAEAKLRVQKLKAELEEEYNLTDSLDDMDLFPQSEFNLDNMFGLKSDNSDSDKEDESESEEEPQNFTLDDFKIDDDDKVSASSDSDEDESESFDDFLSSYRAKINSLKL